ncbi:MAG TPA: hypothetical protein VFG03_12040 [Telluria sp.]|nr:hypothetical protein [Telluria sp.]
MRVLTMLLAASALLAGCTTPQERAARMQAEVDQMVATFGPACSRLGYAENSDPWRNCVLQMSVKDDVQRYGYYPGYYGGMGFSHWHAGGRWGPYW